MSGAHGPSARAGRRDKILQTVDSVPWLSRSGVTWPRARAATNRLRRRPHHIGAPPAAHASSRFAMNYGCATGVTLSKFQSSPSQTTTLYRINLVSGWHWAHTRRAAFTFITCHFLYVQSRRRGGLSAPGGGGSRPGGGGPRPSRACDRLTVGRQRRRARRGPAAARAICRSE